VRSGFQEDLPLPQGLLDELPLLCSHSARSQTGTATIAYHNRVPSLPFVGISHPHAPTSYSYYSSRSRNRPFPHKPPSTPYLQHPLPYPHQSLRRQRSGDQTRRPRQFPPPVAPVPNQVLVRHATSASYVHRMSADVATSRLSMAAPIMVRDDVSSPESCGSPRRRLERVVGGNKRWEGEGGWR